MNSERAERIKRQTRSFVALPGHISVVLLSNSGQVPLANLSYRIHITPDRVLEGRTAQDGLVSHENVPLGEYRLELEGFEGEAWVPSLPVETERYPLRIPGYFLFVDEEDISEEDFPEYEDEEELDLNAVDEGGWEELAE